MALSPAVAFSTRISARMKPPLGYTRGRTLEYTITWPTPRIHAKKETAAIYPLTRSRSNIKIISRYCLHICLGSLKEEQAQTKTSAERPGQRKASARCRPDASFATKFVSGVATFERRVLDRYWGYGQSTHPSGFEQPSRLADYPR